MDFVPELPSVSDPDGTLTGDGQLFRAKLDFRHCSLGHTQSWGDPDDPSLML